MCVARGVVNAFVVMLLLGGSTATNPAVGSVTVAVEVAVFTSVAATGIDGVESVAGRPIEARSDLVIAAAVNRATPEGRAVAIAGHESVAAGSAAVGSAAVSSAFASTVKA
jgi:hypothetical protein